MRIMQQGDASRGRGCPYTARPILQQRGFSLARHKPDSMAS